MIKLKERDKAGFKHALIDQPLFAVNGIPKSEFADTIEAVNQHLEDLLKGYFGEQVRSGHGYGIRTRLRKISRSRILLSIELEVAHRVR